MEIQLNSELKGIFRTLGEHLPSVHVDGSLQGDNVLNVFIKTPNILYNDTKVFLGETEITKELSLNDMSAIRSCMSQAYFNYFTHYNEQYQSKYYKITFVRENEKLEPTAVNKAGRPS